MEIDEAVTKAAREHDSTLAKDIAQLLHHRFKLSYKEVRAWFKQVTQISNKQFDKLIRR